MHFIFLNTPPHSTTPTPILFFSSKVYVRVCLLVQEQAKYAQERYRETEEGR